MTPSAPRRVAARADAAGFAPAGRLIGRPRELDHIAALLDRAADSPAAVLIDGAPGIGKTALWRAAIELAGDAGFRVLRAAPAESEQGLTLGGLTDLLSGIGPQELEVLPGVQRHALEIGLLRSEPSGRPPDQRTLSVASAGLLRSVARERPILVAIDDAQWLDQASIAVLAYALRRLADERVGILVAVRGTATAAVDSLLGGVPHERRDALHLGPLALAELHELFLTRLGRSFPRLVLVRIEAASAGNPFYALEIARALPSSMPLLGPGDRLPIPESLGSLVLARIAALPEATQAALRLTALAVEPTSETILRANRDGLEALEPAIQGGVVVIDGADVRFTHPLLAEAVLARSGAHELRAAHALLASTAVSDDTRARHLGGAIEGRNEDVAAALEAAAAAARARGGTLDAVGLYRRASELTPDPASGAALRRLMLAAECLLIDLSESVEADALLERAIEAGRPGPARAEALSLRALTRYYHGDAPGAVRIAEQAIAEAGDSDTATGRGRRALVLGRAAFVVMQVDLRRGSGLVRDGLRLIDGLPGADPDTLANLLLLDASAAFGLVEGVRRDEIERGRRLMTEDGRSWEHDGVEGIDFGLARATDDLDRAIEMTNDVIRRKAGPGGDDPFNLVMLSELQLLRGEVGAARANAEAADEGYAREGGDVFPAWRLRGLALVAAHEGRHDEARRWATEGLAVAERSADVVQQLYHRRILGFVALASGDPRSADDELTAAAALGRGAGTLHPGRFKLEGDRVEAALAVGDTGRAAEIVAFLDDVNRVAATPWTRAIGARGRGLLNATAGDLDAAVVALEDALVAHDALAMPFERARTLLALGQVHRRRKEKRLADERLREALELFETLHAAAWADRARAELGRVGRRPRAPNGLTDTELQVAMLAAAGLSSREIGERAFLAPKTVGNVLGRVYQKLGIHSRAELGGRMRDGVSGDTSAAGDRSG